MITRNSTSIVKAINDNKDKFDTIKIISQEILEIRKQKEQQVKFIEKSYEVVLKNLASKKKEVIKLDNTTYYVCKTGITKKTHTFAKNADNLMKGDFLKSLVEVKENLTGFLDKISKEKQEVLKKFLEKANLLKQKNPILLSDLNMSIDWVDDSKRISKLHIKYQYTNDINIGYGHNWEDKIETIRPDFEGYVILEQLYTKIKKVLERELKQNQKELENMKKFLKDIDTKFSNYIQSVEMLKELGK